MKEKRLHRDCDPHTTENCDINDHGDLEPGADDCGHYVDGTGPIAHPEHVPGGPGHADCDHE